MNLTKEYPDVFLVRGHSYEKAMKYSPFSREREFSLLFRETPLTGGETILDIPSGGGYLSKFLPCRFEIIECEFTSGFGEGRKILPVYGDWNLPEVDRVVCLAALHHIGDLERFIKQLSSVLRKGGIVHLADVSRNSKESLFLDGFVNEWTFGGHKGFYREWEEISWSEEFKVRRVKEEKCPWNFFSIEEMLSFTKDLFCIPDCPDETLRNILESQIGVTRNDHCVSLQWGLTYVDLEKAG